MPGHLQILHQAKNLHKCLYTKTRTYKSGKTTTRVYSHNSVITKGDKVPSAPKSGLKDFFSLKFLNSLTMLLLSLMAYLLLNMKPSLEFNTDVRGRWSYFAPTWYLLRWVVCPDKFLSWPKTLVSQSHCSIDDVLSISTHHNKPGGHSHTNEWPYCTFHFSFNDICMFLGKILSGITEEYIYLPLGLCWMVWG